MTAFCFRSQVAATDAYLRAAEALVPGFASWGGADLSASPACLVAGHDPIWIGRLVSASGATREERRAWAIDALGAADADGDLLAAAIGLDDSRVSLWFFDGHYLVQLEGSRAERVASSLLWDVASSTRAEAP
jgi:hypothetical protein